MGVYIRTGTPWPEPRTPWANTIAYFPLKDDILDQTWNLTLTHGTMTKATVGYNVTGWAKVTTNWAVYYMWGWCNVQQGYDAYVAICTCDNPEMGYYYKHVESKLNHQCYVAYNSSFDVSNASVVIWENSRHHYAISYSWGKSCVYIDGVKRVEYNWIGYNFWNMAYLFSTWSGGWQTPNSWSGVAYISDYILESVWWTDQEVADYYNSTKSNYWIS